MFPLIAFWKSVILPKNNDLKGGYKYFFIDPNIWSMHNCVTVLSSFHGYDESVNINYQDADDAGDSDDSDDADDADDADDDDDSDDADDADDTDDDEDADDSDHHAHDHDEIFCDSPLLLHVHDNGDI